MRFSLRAKIASITIAILFLAMGALTLISTRFFAREYSKALQSNGFIIGQNLKFQLDRLLGLGIPLEDLIGFEEQCRGVVEKYKDISYAMVVNLDGEILFHSDPGQHGNKISDQEILKALRDTRGSVHTSLIDGKEYQFVIIPILSPHDEHIAAVGIGFPTELIIRATTRLVNYSVEIAFIFFAVAISLLVVALSIWVTTPLMRLISAIQEISKKGLLTTRVEVKSRDEIGQLASTFNKMTEDLQRTTTSINNLNREIDERKRVEDALRRSESKHRTLLENIPQKIFYKDLNSVYLLCNESYAEDLNITAGEIAGKTDYDFFPKELADKYRADDKRIIQTGRMEELEEEYITGGKRFIVQTCKAPVKDEEGNVIGIFGIFWDITARKEAEEKLRNAYSQLKQTQDQLIQAEKLNAIGQLASGVAHEVRNPLGCIMQGIYYLEQTMSPADKDSLETISLIKGSVGRADKIISALLDFSKATALDIRPEDINSVLEDSLTLVRTRYKFENIDVVRQMKEDIPKVMVDKGRMEQVFVNILLNAIHALPEGGTLTIRSYAKRLEHIRNGIGKRKEDHFRPGEEAVIVEVEDAGTGISEKDLKRIFDPFFTTKGPKGGAGLGLSVCRNIITMHKALIDAESELGKGTKIIITLKTA